MYKFARRVKSHDCAYVCLDNNGEGAKEFKGEKGKTAIG